LSKKSRLAGQKPVEHDFTYLTAFSEGGAPPASPPFRVCHIKNSLSFMISYRFFAVNKHSLKIKKFYNKKNYLAFSGNSSEELSMAESIFGCYTEFTNTKGGLVAMCSLAIHLSFFCMII